MALFSLSRGAAALFGFVLLTTSLAAQSMSVTPGGGLTVGSNATIAYSDAKKAGQTIVVTVSGGYPVVTTYEVSIVLDAAGNGTGTWTVVSGWRGAHFNAPGVTETALSISP